MEIPQIKDLSINELDAILRHSKNEIIKELAQSKEKEQDTKTFAAYQAELSEWKQFVIAIEKELETKIFAIKNQYINQY